MDLLKNQGASIEYFDPYIPLIPSTREHKEWMKKESIAWNQETLSSFDATVIITHHSNIQYEQLLRWCPLIVDTRNALASFESKDNQVWKA